MGKEKVHTQYHLADGSRVASVTTILGVLAKPALIHWAWKLGCEGIDYKAVRDQAADAGTLAHYIILCHLTGLTPDTRQYSKETMDKAENSVLSYYEWEKAHTMEPILTETYLVSEKHRYGGTIDFYGIVDGEPMLVDFKTSSGIYPDMFYQLAAYAELLEENGYPVKGAKILRIGRDEDEGFEERGAGNLVPQLEMFHCCKQIYELQKQIKREFK